MKKMSNILGISLVLVLFLFGCGSKPDTQTPPVFGLTPYENQKYQFKLNYPSHWVQGEIKPLPTEARFGVRFDPKENSKFPIKITVWDKTFEQRKQEIGKEYVIKGANQAGYAKSTWDRFIVNKKDNTVTYIFLLLQQGKYLYEISGLGFESGIAVNDDVFSIIWSSFELIDKN